MSNKRKLLHAAHTINKKTSGARSTKVARQRNIEEFINYCSATRIDLKNINNISSENLAGYAHHLALATLDRKGNSPGTIHNKMASIRTFLKGLGMDLANKGMLSNSGLEIDRRSRIGTKQPISDEAFASAIERATVQGETGFVHCIRLERYLGLRGLEAIMSPAALLDYAQEAQYMSLDCPTPMPVVDGTKGGRPRETTVIKKYALASLKAICDALEFSSKNGGFLIAGKSPGLKAARSRYHKIAASVGLVGKYAPHSLRYRFATDKLEELRDMGVPRNEALTQTSQWLGHGPGRGRWVSMVYGRTVTHTFPKATRRNSQRQVLANIQALFVKSNG